MCVCVCVHASVHVCVCINIQYAQSSTRNEALAAVTVPCGLTKAGLSLAICSGVDTLIPLSTLTVDTFLPAGMQVGTVGLHNKNYCCTHLHTRYKQEI